MTAGITMASPAPCAQPNLDESAYSMSWLAQSWLRPTPATSLCARQAAHMRFARASWSCGSAMTCGASATMASMSPSSRRSLVSTSGVFVR